MKKKHKKSQIKEVWKSLYSPLKFFFRKIKKIFLKIIHSKEEKRKLAEVVDNVQNSLKEINFRDGDYVIISRNFYDSEGNFCWNGGSERYYIDLAEVIKKTTKKNVVILQLSCRKSIVKQFRNCFLITLKNVAEENYDNVLNQILHSKNIAISDIGLILNLKVKQVKISHGICFDNFGIMNTPLLKNFTDSIKKSDLIVSVDAVTISFFAGLLGKDYYKKSFYIPNYADSSLYLKKQISKDERLTILYPRRLCPERGFEIMLEIAEELLATCNIKFIFCGSGNEKEVKKVHDLTKRFPDICKHIVSQPEEMYRIYQEADIAVIPTQFSEGTSLSCIEAMMSGNAIVSTYVGGLSNLIIDDFNGLLCSTNKEEIRNSIIKLIEDENLRKTLSKNATEVSKSFSKQRWQKNWNKLLSSL